MRIFIGEKWLAPTHGSAGDNLHFVTLSPAGVPRAGAPGEHVLSDTVINGKTVIGSIVGTRNDLGDVFAAFR